jgi:ATP-dependent Clp protease adaptor protein ClpS
MVAGQAVRQESHRESNRAMDQASEPPEPDPVEGTGAATMVAAPKPKSDQRRKRQPRYHVILWDSDGHSYDYVERMLRELFGHTAEECHKMAKTVDSEGRVVVLTTTREHAELKRDQIHAYGKDDHIKGSKGSMHSTIEPES